MGANDGTTTENSNDPADVGRCYCPAGGIFDLLGRRHAMRVVCVVGALEPVRFGEIEEAFGEVSSSTLATRLEELTEAGVLYREQYDEIPPRVEYGLTGEGQKLRELLAPLVEWARTRDRAA